MFNLNAAVSYVEGSEKTLEQTQRSSAHYYQRPDKDYARLDTTRTSLAGSGGRMQLMKLNGKWNFLGAVPWKTPGFETNDLGYLRQSDQIFPVLWAGFNFGGFSIFTGLPIYNPDKRYQWQPKGSADGGWEPAEFLQADQAF
jgi:hypothetical protein